MSQAERWIDGFPGLSRLEPGLREALESRSRVINLPAGSRIFGPGQAPENYLLLIAGTIRVQQVSEGGREIVLYRVSAGESCALTTACLMAYEDYLAEAIDRILRIIVGLALLSVVFVGPQTYWGLIGIIPLVTAFTGFCPAYSLLGIRTNPMRTEKRL